MNITNTPYNFSGHRSLGVHFEEAPASTEGAKKEEPAKETPKEKSLHESVKEAMEKNLEAKKDDKEPKKEVKVEAKKEEKKDDELTAEQLEYAKKIFRALDNPKTADKALEVLATAQGFKLNKQVKEAVKEGETKKESVDLVAAAFKEALGDEYGFLTDKLVVAFKKAIKPAIDEEIKDLREDNKSRTQNEMQSQLSNEYDDAFGQFENGMEVEAEAVALMDKYKPAEDVTFKEYVKSLITLAAAEKGVALKAKGSKESKKEDRTKTNRENAGDRLSSERGAEVKVGVSPAKKMSLKDSIEDALQKVNEESKAR